MTEGARMKGAERAARRLKVLRRKRRIRKAKSLASHQLIDTLQFELPCSPVLHDLLSSHRGELVKRCREKVAKRSAPESTADELDHGIPYFLDQLIKTLQIEQTDQPMDSRKVSGPSGGGTHALTELGETASRHGGDLMRRGFTVEQVVHDYGDLCQGITDLAFELGLSVEVDEFRTLNRCLDNAIAMAVTEYNYQRDSVMADRQAQALNLRIGFFAHELRNYLNTASLALFAVKSAERRSFLTPTQWASASSLMWRITVTGCLREMWNTCSGHSPRGARIKAAWGSAFPSVGAASRPITVFSA
jgi:hypothetical protein